MRYNTELYINKQTSCNIFATLDTETKFEPLRFYTELSLTINIWKAGWENAYTESVQRNVSCIKMGGICLQQKTAGNIHACQLQPIKPTLKYKTEQTSSCNMLSFNIFNNAISATINHRIPTTLPKDTYQTWAGRQKGNSLDPWASLHKSTRQCCSLPLQTWKGEGRYSLHICRL